MKLTCGELSYSTQGHTDIVNITCDVQDFIGKSGLKQGMAFLFVAGSTAALTTCEFEGGLEQDLKDFFEKLIPEKKGYHHDAAWGDANGFSHLRASLLKPSLSVPFIKGQAALGTWQQIVLLDFDNRPRQRKIVIQLQGE